MTLDIKILEKNLRKDFHAEVSLIKLKDNLVFIEMPLFFPDGDAYQVYIKEMEGKIRLTDMGHTLLHLSYENDITKLMRGEKEVMFYQILTKNGIKEEKGEFLIDTNLDTNGFHLSSLTKALTSIFVLPATTFNLNSALNTTEK